MPTPSTEAAGGSSGPHAASSNSEHATAAEAFAEIDRLSSQMAIRAIAKAVEAYKRDKRVHVRFQPHGAMVYDERIMSFKGRTHVSLLCLGGRQLLPIRYGAYQAARLDRAKGQTDLILCDGTFWWDASEIYGSDLQTQRDLRGTDGKLKMDDGRLPNHPQFPGIDRTN